MASSERSQTPPRLLTIAGSDSGGGAGIQADLKTFAAHGAYGMSVLTAVTAQNTLGVRAVHPVPPEVVAAQIDAVFEDIGVDAVKIGMLANAEIVAAVAERLAVHAPRHVVLDPVMVAKSGDPLLEAEAADALGSELVPLATLVTPNLPEAERLAGDALEDRESLGRALAERWEVAVLLKGGHAMENQAGSSELEDLLFAGGEVLRFSHRRIETSSTHGTGCTLSSAIAARLGRGEELAAAVGGAIDYLHGAIAAAYPLGGGHGPVNHLYALDYQ